MSNDLLGTLLRRGAVIFVREGVLHVEHASGQPPNERQLTWLRENSETIIAGLWARLRYPVFRYIEYSTGKYGSRKSPGVTIQFEVVGTGGTAYAIFNAELTRARSTKAGKKGEPLPSGQFRVNPGHALTKLWTRTNLPPPRRLAAMHDYMGKLRAVLFVGEFCEGERLDKATLRPLELTSEQVRAVAGFGVAPDNSRTSSGQSPDNFRTRLPDKDLPESQAQRGFSANSATGGNHYGNTVKGSTGTRESPSPKVIPISAAATRLQDQTIQDWMADYDSGN